MASGPSVGGFLLPLQATDFSILLVMTPIMASCTVSTSCPSLGVPRLKSCKPWAQNNAACSRCCTAACFSKVALPPTTYTCHCAHQCLSSPHALVHAMNFSMRVAQVKAYLRGTLLPCSCTMLTSWQGKCHECLLFAQSLT